MAERREAHTKRAKQKVIGHDMRAGQCKGGKRVVQSHGGAGNAEGEEETEQQDQAAVP